MYYFLENDPHYDSLISQNVLVLENIIGNKAGYSEKHCVLGNMQPIEGYDFQKVLHIRKIDGRTDMFFPKCMTFWENAVNTGSVFPEKPLIEPRTQIFEPSFRLTGKNHRDTDRSQGYRWYAVDRARHIYMCRARFLFCLSAEL